jgi:hypothetical protein
VNGAKDHELLRALADAVVDQDPARVAPVTARLASLSGPGWLRLDELARAWKYTRQAPLDEVADWRPLLAVGNDAVHLAAASMYRDGRVREAAVRALDRTAGPVAAAALAVRVADWVPEIGSAASAALAARTEPEDVAAIISVLLALRQRRRGERTAAGYLAAIAAGPAATLEALAVAGERARRLWALAALAPRGLLSPAALAERAKRDPDPVVALWCARSLAGPDGELPPGIGAQLLESGRAGVRAFAAGHVSADELTRQRLGSLLLDHSGAVRSIARWRWRRDHGSAAPVYRAALTSADRPGRIAAALQGLSEDHDGSLPAAAVPFLTHRSPAVRRAAAQAIGQRADGAELLRHLVPLLLDDSGKVAAVALRHIRGQAVPAGLLTTLDAAGTVRARRMALSIRQRSGTWNRVHADLAALGGGDPDLVEAGRRDLLSWLQHGAATSYGRPSAVQAAEIAELLATGRLSQQQRREIAFVAGVRLPANARE